MIRIAIVLWLFLSPQSKEWYGKVTAVLDGDTIDVMHNGKPERIRLEGIDAPERAQKQGTEARAFINERIYGKEVKVISTGTDKYGRTLAHVYIDADNTAGEFPVWLNKVLVVSGLAWHYKKYSQDKELAAAEELARKFQTGVWKDPNPIAPWDFRKTQKN